MRAISTSAPVVAALIFAGVGANSASAAGEANSESPALPRTGQDGWQRILWRTHHPSVHLVQQSGPFVRHCVLQRIAERGPIARWERGNSAVHRQSERQLAEY